MRRYSYTDTKIVHITPTHIHHKEKTYYLRMKFGRRGATCVLTIRTHKNGKGKRIAEVKGIIKDDQSQIELIRKLCKKFKFAYIHYVDIA